MRCLELHSRRKLAPYQQPVELTPRAWWRSIAVNNVGTNIRKPTVEYTMKVRVHADVGVCVPSEVLETSELLAV